MATVADKSGNSPVVGSETHINSKQEQIINNTAP